MNFDPRLDKVLASEVTLRDRADIQVRRLTTMIASLEETIGRFSGSAAEDSVFKSASNLLSEATTEQALSTELFSVLSQNPSLFRAHPRDGLADVWQLRRDWTIAAGKLQKLCTRLSALLSTKSRYEPGQAAGETGLAAKALQDAAISAALDRDGTAAAWAFTISHALAFLVKHSPLRTPATGLLGSGPAAIAPPPWVAKSAAQGNMLDLVRKTRLFDDRFYRSQFRNGLSGVTDALLHYVSEGWMQNKDPNPLFCTAYYLARNPSVLTDGPDPLSHYVFEGSALGADPHPLFLTPYYRESAAAGPSPGQTWLEHFLGASINKSPHPLFDVAFYGARIGQTALTAQAALLHYLVRGWRYRIEFSPLFRLDFYLGQLTGGSAGIEPYTHFVLHGVAALLDPHPLFDSAFYLSQNSSDKAAAIDPLAHYCTVGEAAGSMPSHFFDPKFYRDEYLEKREIAGSLLHYVTEGFRQDFRPLRHFDSKLYRKLFLPDGAATPWNGAMEHFLTKGVYTLTSRRMQDLLAPPQVEKAPESAKAQSGKARPATAIGQEAAQALGYREYPGKLTYVAGRRNVLVVAHVAAEYLFGSERSFLDMLDGLAHVPCNIFVVLPRNVPDYTNLIRTKSHLVSVMKYGWWRKDQAPSDIVRNAFVDLIGSLQIDAVHANTIMLRECLEAARISQKPSVVHVRELITHDQALVEIIGKPAVDIIAEVQEKADWIIGNSKTTAQAFWKPGRTFVIPNTVADEAFDAAPLEESATIRFGMISSNIPKKGLADVIELARLAEGQCPAAEFVLIGPETEAVKQLQQQQQDGTVPKNVVFPGYAPDPAKALAKLHVVLNFSHFAESFGRTVLEAMAASRPVIAYDFGALPELILHGVSGFLVPYRKPEAALPYVMELCQNPALLKQLGEQGQKFGRERYSASKYRQAFARAYRAMVPADVPPPNTATGPLIRPARLPNLKTLEETPRIAYFCWHFPVPSETFVLNELEVLVGQGADVLVFCRQSPHKNFKPGFPIKFERVTSADHLAKRLAETSRTIVHAHFTFPTVTDMVWPACEKAEIPFTFIAHAQDIFKFDNDRRNKLAEIGASPWCRKVFTLSRFHYNFLASRGVPKEKLAINPNAVDTTRFAAARIDNREGRNFRKIISVHRFVPKKGLSLLIQAAALIKDMDVTIHIYGYGDLEAEYRRLVSELQLSNVFIHGQLTQDEIVGVMREADLFACPSVRTPDGDMDGIPTSLVESMAAGLPVLTTAIAGIPDLVVDGITGFIAEPNPQSIADTIRRFYAAPAAEISAIIDDARRVAVRNHDARKLVRVLTRVWTNRLVDIVIVAWNNLQHLRAVVERVLANTLLPYHLIICDNQSTIEPVPQFLEELWSEEERVTVIHNDSNAMVGPGTNMALSQGTGDYAIYVCGKEGVSFANGWEIPFVHAFEDNPEAGLIGTIGWSPTYLTGEQYPTGIRLFPKFRNQDFAARNKSRHFGHVQGGLFGMRRRMVDTIGGFSDDVPHDYTDVEYSYYAESCGWKLGEAPGVLALFNKSRPTLSQRFDENVVVAHPVLPHEVSRYDGVLAGRLNHCNICDWYGTGFSGPNLACGGCGSVPEDRTLFRWLSESSSMYRRLPALGVGLSGQMERTWREQFQGPCLPLADFGAELAKNNRLKNNSGSLSLAFLRLRKSRTGTYAQFVQELNRLLKPGSVALFQGERDEKDWPRQQDQLRTALTKAGFRQLDDVRFASRAVRFSYVPMMAFEKT